MVILPAGTGHQYLSADDDFLVVGAYPPAGTSMSVRQDRPRTEVNSEGAGSARKDPVCGVRGPLSKLWKKAKRPNISPASLGEAVVSAFAMLGDLLRPKSFAGLFGAAPSCSRTLGIAVYQHGGGYAAMQSRSMMAGTAALAIYGIVVCMFSFARGCEPYLQPCCLAAWLVVAFGLLILPGGQHDADPPFAVIAQGIRGPLCAWRRGHRSPVSSTERPSGDSFLLFRPSSAPAPR
jgi:hypothetical protein